MRIECFIHQKDKIFEKREIKSDDLLPSLNDKPDTINGVNYINIDVLDSLNHVLYTVKEVFSTKHKVFDITKQVLYRVNLLLLRDN